MTNDRHTISVLDAAALTARWRKSHPDAMRAARFDRIAFDRLLSRPGVAGIRIYLAMQSGGEWTYVMVATDGNGKDILGDVGDVTGTAGTGVEEQAYPCPPYCDCSSPLNGDCPPDE
ncbi:MAG: hypothetical protein IPO52_13630 [Gemmatimonadetes bacterium]|nr:hypothetical protein [Gemmatimonadota bacterium]MBK7594938.1 hypothetical protein [Gemmatimonadota bacterium]MBK9550106.1 hypothetical protein [Gemmatimonadota bacterium]MBP6443207.1 hypothetical protein [Gemmatimonadales bacterium]MBP9896948.1 hypothetical protein [Gemmatimonadales bacterium]